MDKLNYGVIGNCCTAALISDKGSIDWLCFPNFDSPSIFASLLDREKGGYFGFEVSPDYQISQSYVPHTNILSTNFVSEENEFAVVDFMPLLPSESMRAIVIVRQRSTDISAESKVLPVLKSTMSRLRTMPVERQFSTRPRNI